LEEWRNAKRAVRRASWMKYPVIFAKEMKEIFISRAIRQLTEKVV
jgi:hypothetical protein